MSAAEKRNERASSQNAHSMGRVDAMNPDAANPTAVDPNELIDIIELAAASSSSGATSGRTASLAGSKNVETALASATRMYSQMIPKLMANGIRKTRPARIRSDATMIFLRSTRSTKTPANRPMSSVGMAVAISMSPTARAEPVSR